jgi:hypothetical protein
VAEAGVTLADVIAAFSLETEDMSDPIAGAYYDALITASKIRAKFADVVGREPDAVDHAIAASLFIEKNRANKPQGNGGGGYKPAGGGGGGNRGPYVPKKCDVCGSECWDNRKKKRENPAEWGNAPDYACKDKACSSHKKNKIMPAPAGGPFDDDSDDLGF